MGALGGSNGGLWWNFPPKGGDYDPFRRKRRRGSQLSDSSAQGGDRSGTSNSNNSGYFNFPVKQATTAASLCLAGDTIAQFGSRWTALNRPSSNHKDIISSLLSNHDWLRSLRMASYGFLLYGPGSYAWYQYLDRSLPKHTVKNMLLKVLLNQIVLGPCVISVVFAWNDLWKGNLSKLPTKYKKDALPTLLYGFRFWIPASMLNFWVIPLQARVAFMSTCSIFWNFYLSSTMSK